MPSKAKFTTFDAYIARFPKDIQGMLERIRQTIKEAAPGAVEAISYQIPTFKLNGSNLVHFAAWKDHIGFYATPSGSGIQERAGAVKGGEGLGAFPLEEPILMTWWLKLRSSG